MVTPYQDSFPAVRLGRKPSAVQLSEGLPCLRNCGGQYLGHTPLLKPLVPSQDYRTEGVSPIGCTGLLKAKVYFPLPCSSSAVLTSTASGLVGECVCVGGGKGVLVGRGGCSILGGGECV